MSVSLSREGDLARITLAAPPLNLFDEAAFAGFEAAVDDLEARPPRAVLIDAAGKVVSAGVDVKVFDAIASVAEAGRLWERLLRLPRRLEALPCPTVFAAHGLCLTAAFEIGLGCDLLLAAESATFGLVEIVVGLTPAMGGTQRLVERAGPARARELVMTGELYDARTLHGWNVVNRVLPDEGFADAASAFARRLAAGPTCAHVATKQIVRAALDGGVDAADALVPELAGGLFATEDLQGAVASFSSRAPARRRTRAAEMAVAVTPDGAWIHWHQAGPPDGPPVLMIMGLGGSSRAWWRLVPHVTAAHRALLFDNRGTGDSDRVTGVMTLERMAGDAIAVLDAAGVGEAHIVGISMGGMIAQQLALSHRDRVASLSLLCTSPGGRDGAPPWRLLASSALRPFVGPAGTFGLAAPMLYGARAREEMEDRLAEDLAHRAQEETPALTAWAQMAGIARWNVRDRLAELAGIPTLVVHGEDDALVPFARGEALARGIPGARLVALPACGHLLTTEAEPAVAAAVVEHLSGACTVPLRCAASSV
jgi:enoyl-CoA hydratase/carnithine racemase/pimeloyl-ACP methyl ester carboxylesterase